MSIQCPGGPSGFGVQAFSQVLAERPLVRAVCDEFYLTPGLAQDIVTDTFREG